MSRLTAEHLRALRNQISIERLIGLYLRWPCKRREGIFRFLCPLCQEFNTATNPRTNLARCFRCQRNFNPIDFVIVVHRCDFLQAVAYLEPFLPEAQPR
jgi:DNA primase